MGKKTEVLAFIVHKTPEYVLATLAAGADGYILKDASRHELIDSIEDILAGKQVVHSDSPIS